MKRALAIGMMAVCGMVAQVQAQVGLVADTSKRHQVMDGFGVAAVSDWVSEIVALYNNPAFAKAVTDDLRPSILRVECPTGLQPAEDLDPNVLDLTKFDFTVFSKTAGLVQNMYAANNKLKFMMTVWSPPWWMKSGWSPYGGKLRPERYPHFAKFGAGACIGYEATYGVPVYAFSLQNEPRFENPFHSCVYEPWELADAVTFFGPAWQQFKPKSKVMVGENHAYLPGPWVVDYAKALFQNPNAKPRTDIYAIHGYAHENFGNFGTVLGWQMLKAQLDQYPLAKRWHTEDSGQDPSWLGANGDGNGALRLAQNMHSALTGGDVQAWMHWGLIDGSPSAYSLMYLKPEAPGFAYTPKYHAFRHYCRFIDEGAVRVDLKFQTADVIGDAFFDDGDQRFTIVLTNLGATAQDVTTTITLPPLGVHLVGARHIQSKENSYSKILANPPITGGNKVTVNMPAKSMSTIVVTYRGNMGSRK